MIITCPHCQTKYQVTYEAIGSAGRKVQCAHCQQAWQQQPFTPEPALPEQIDAISEDALDEVMADTERAALAQQAAHKPAEESKDSSSDKADAKLRHHREKAFTKRQTALQARLPLARTRRAIRLGSAIVLLALSGLLYFERTEVVELYPAMADVYAGLGMPVNVVGLDFDAVQTLRSLQNGRDMLRISAHILGVNSKPIAVPPVLVTLLDGHGSSVYQWSVTPGVPDLMAGERATFSTQLIMPPGDASRVRLSFADGSTTPDRLSGGSAPGLGADPSGENQSGHNDVAGHVEPAHSTDELPHDTSADAHGHASAEPLSDPVSEQHTPEHH